MALDIHSLEGKNENIFDFQKKKSLEGNFKQDSNPGDPKIWVCVSQAWVISVLRASGSWILKNPFFRVGFQKFSGFSQSTWHEFQLQSKLLVH